MITFERELAAARDRGALDPILAERLIAIERREVFSIAPELRTVSWLAVLMIVGGLGAIVKNNLDAIGPMAIIAAIGVAAAACYASAVRTLLRGATRTAVGDYILLLGGLLLAADFAVAESQLHVLGANWEQHFAVIALLHAIGAYVFASKQLLSASLAAFAAWLGVSAKLKDLFDADTDVATAALVAAAAIAMWAYLDHRFARDRGFSGTFDFFVANTAMFAAIVFTFERKTSGFGVLLGLATAALAIWRGMKTRAMALVVFAVIGVTIVLDIAAVEAASDAAFIWILITTPAAIALLFVLHREMKVRR